VRGLIVYTTQTIMYSVSSYGNWRSAAAVLLVALFVCSAAFGGGRDLTTPPADPDEAYRVQIWIPAKMSTRCRLAVEIRDGRNQVVRNLVEEFIGAGYYNYYWDKKDDSGHWVEPGRYLAVADICGERRYRDLHAEYVAGERELRTASAGGERPDTLVYEVMADSIPVVINVHDLGGQLMAGRVVDTALAAGSYRLTLQPDWVVPKVEARYELRLEVLEYVHYDTIWYRP